MRVAAEVLASQGVSTVYDSTRWYLGNHLMRQRTDVSPNFVGPIAMAVARPFETAGAIPGYCPWAIAKDYNTDYVFLADQFTAAATRRIQLYEFNKNNSSWLWKGFTTVTFPTATAYTIKAMRMTKDVYNDGYVVVNGSTVSGYFNDFSLFDGGSRIGFGTTDPAQVSTWYELRNWSKPVSGGPNYLLTNYAGGTYSGVYVLEDWRCVLATTNATATNGGLYVIKGLHPGIFQVGGTTIPSGSTIDNMRACIWLADAATESNTVAVGAGLEDRINWWNHNVFVLDTAGGVTIFKYNLRAPLDTGMAAGKTISGFMYKTGASALTGTVGTINNGRWETVQSGPASGMPSLYFATTTRVYRAATSGIQVGVTNFLSDAMTENPPGGVATYAATATMSMVDTMESIDRLLIGNTSAASAREYITQYRTDAGQFDHIFLAEDKQIDQGAEDVGAAPHPSLLIAQMYFWTENGMCYAARAGITAVTNLLYAWPLGADWQYASKTNSRIITPAINTPNCNKYVRVLVTNAEYVGSVNLGKPVDPFRVYYRTAGISDNSGGWSLVTDTGDLSAVGGAAQIQFMIEFKTISEWCISGRIYNLSVVYDDMDTDYHYQPSIKWSDVTNKRFAWRMSQLWNGTVPTMRVRIYDAVTNGLLVDDATVAPTGTWEKSIDGGGSWIAYNTSDKANEITYIRYTPASLGDNIRVRALLTTY